MHSLSLSLSLSHTHTRQANRRQHEDSHKPLGHKQSSYFPFYSPSINKSITIHRLSLNRANTQQGQKHWWGCVIKKTEPVPYLAYVMFYIDLKRRTSILNTHTHTNKRARLPPQRYRFLWQDTRFLFSFLLMFFPCLLASSPFINNTPLLLTRLQEMARAQEKGGGKRSEIDWGTPRAGKQGCEGKKKPST